MAMIGADGAVPGLANVDVQGYVRLWEAALAGDIFKARAEQERLNKLFEIVFCAQGRSGDAAGVGAFKVAMQSLGLLGSAKMAAPIKPFESSEIKSIEKIVSDAALVKAN